MTKDKLKTLKIIDIITRSIYDIGKAVIPAMIMVILFKTQPNGVDFGQRVLSILMLFSGFCVEYLKLNKYIHITENKNLKFRFRSRK